MGSVGRLILGAWLEKQLTRVIAGQGSTAYLAAMAAALFRLLALLALVLMPLSGVTAPAAAQPVPSAEAGHCGDRQQPAEDPLQQQAHCMACNALAATGAPPAAAELAPETPRLLIRIHGLYGVEPELATPPPKLS